MTPKTMLYTTVATTTVALVTYSALLLRRDEPEATASSKVETQTQVPALRGVSGPSRRAPSTAGLPTRGVVAARAEQPEGPPPSAEQQRMKVIEYEAQREAAFIGEFEAESVDGTWAAQWEPQLTSTLEGVLSDHTGFVGMTIECRSERCVAEATWDDYKSATGAIGATMDATKGVCGTSVFMPPPDDPEASYRHSVRFFGCQDDPA